MSKTIAGLDIPQHPPKRLDDKNVTINDLFSLKGKVASITGSSTGIGFAVAEAFCQAGAAGVAVWYNSHNPSEKVKYLTERYGTKIKAYQVQITDSAAVEKAIADQIKEFGHIDIFVANAGVPWQKGPLIDQNDYEEWNRVVDLDFHGAMYCAQAIGKHFKERGSGSLIFTASMSGTIVNVPQLQACYNAVKAGIIHFARSLAVEWAGFARVNCVSPGYTLTEISDFVPKDTQSKWWQYTPLGRGIHPKELVGGYLYLASDASTATTGLDLRIDAGYACP